MSNISNEVLCSAGFWGALPSDIAVQITQNEKTGSVAWYLDKLTINKSVQDFSRNFNQIIYSLKNKAIQLGSERSSLLMEMVKGETEHSVSLKDRDISVIRQLHRLEAMISACAYTNVILQGTSKTYTSKEIKNFESDISSITNSFKCQAICYNTGRNSFSWSSDDLYLDKIPSKYFVAQYDFYACQERDAFSLRCSLLKEMAHINVYAEDKSAAKEFKKNICFLEGAGELFRYAQHVILKRYMETTVPLDQRTPQWEPSNKDKIRYFAEVRGIKYLLHFTRVENLDSIIKKGLRSRDAVDNSKVIKAKTNDDKRLDKQTDHICVSVSYPNYNMLSKYSGSFAVIRLSASILWEKDCGFNYFNAATNVMRLQSIDDRQIHSVFEKMFEYQLHIDKNLPTAYTTDVQAEILVPGKIETSYIKDIFFIDEQSRENWNLNNKVEINTKNHWHLFFSRENFLKHGGYEGLDESLEDQLGSGAGQEPEELSTAEGTAPDIAGLAKTMEKVLTISGNNT